MKRKINPSLRLSVFVSSLIPLLLTHPALCANHALQMKVTDKSYLDARGVCIMLCVPTFSPVFFDQKYAGMQIILHGNRIVADGNQRFLATPEKTTAMSASRSAHIDEMAGSVA